LFWAVIPTLRPPANQLNLLDFRCGWCSGPLISGTGHFFGGEIDKEKLKKNCLFLAISLVAFAILILHRKKFYNPITSGYPFRELLMVST